MADNTTVVQIKANGAPVGLRNNKVWAFLLEEMMDTAADWVIIDPDGGLIDRSRFLAVIDSGALSHETMESEDFRVRVYGDMAVSHRFDENKGQIHGARLQHPGTSDR